MYLVTHALILLFGIYICNAGYGIPAQSGTQDAQSDVQAPAYIPSYLKNQRFTKTGYSKSYSGLKTSSGGTKTAGTKTGYAGTKTVKSAGIKTAYAGTKTGSTKTAYTGTKNVQPSKTGYSESKTWSSGYGAAPSFQEFHSKANEPYAAKCEPECKNNGICVDTNTCHCPVNYYGKYCEFEKKPCLTYPPLPMNSRRKCSSDLCTITCMEGHKFIDGSTVANMRCVDGQWQPTRADFSSIPDCEPECNPPCANGGVCLALNTCQCAADYRGPQCQYAANVCDVRKLAFNGGYNCFGDSEKFSCKLNCPSGSTYSSTPAEVYTCLYSSGQFEPQPIPHCVFNEVVVITPSNGHSEYSSNSQYYETHFENHTSKNYGYGYESETSSGRGDIDIELLGGSGHGKGGYGQGHADTEYDQSQSHAGFDQSQTAYGEPTYGHKYGDDDKPVKIVVQDFTPKGGTCLSWAGVHYKTFDGKIYSFQSSCQHILVRDAKEHKYTVAIRQGECKRQSYCPTELTVYLEDKPYVLSVGEDGSVVFRSTKRLIPIPASLPGIRVAMPSDYVVVNLDALGVTIKWDTNNLVLVEGTVLLWNNTEGLCGRLDGNPVNDLTTKEGKIAKTKSVLASSWQLNKIGDICDSNPTETSACASKSDEDMKKALQFCTKIFSKDKFRKCSKAMDVSLLLEACQWDFCACTTSLSPEECACSTVSVYAKECLRHGVEEMKNWRDADTCPMKCPEGKLYQACGPDAQPSCAFPLLSAKADNSTCVEGCYCPEGLLLEGGRCVPKENCPCRLRNKAFPPGSVVPKDCNTCTCQSGEWTCTQVPCGARCGAVGDPHYTTFDGLRYDFMGHCTYNLLKTDNITVEVENVACSGAITEAMNLAPYKGAGKPSCTKAVNLIYEGINVHLKQGGFILVNGKEVASLPVHIGDVLIRAASSLFVIVQLPIGVDLWWDGNTRIFVDVPPEFAGKTKGLCGTFNLNQKDDFLTPEGDVEQSALAFANKWKTREFCDDVETKEPEHPCKANVENKETADKYCTKLKSKLFEACHWHVDVEPYYEECVYDMCACSGDAARCLCPILGDYAMACAKAGVKIQWRYNVKECELSCSGGQEYTVCADSCQRTCSDVALSATGRCKPVCVEGCACAPGQVLDNSGVCVPIGLCPCYHKGMQFDAGYKEVRAGRRERELCTCVGARWDCKPATPEEVQNYPPAEDMRNNCSAAHHMEFTTCEIAEPLTCKNMHLPPSSTTAECRPGCQCKKGYVLDTTSKKCVLASQCPCHHGGRSYPDGYVMQEECNKCECKNGNWTCTQRKCAGVCGAWGDSHITTFDGADYDFEGVCTYLLAKGVLDANDGFDVEIQNVPCGTTGATCSKSLTLKVGTGNNEEIVSLTKNVPIPDLSKLKRIKLRMAGSYVFLDVPSLGMSVQWDRGMRVYVKVDAMWQNRVKGLCGNYNADLRDDFQTPSGGGIAETSALLFADSWKLKSTCPKPQPVRDHCQQRPERKEWATMACGALKRYPFTLCHTEVPPTAFIERCEKDACACDSGEDCECACTALAAYAQRCSARGVVFKWRTQERCPMQCDEECSNYDACVSACPLETCDNIHYYEETRPLCEHDTCVEGCKPKKSCPEGSVYSNRSYTECVPIAKCKPVCMTLPDGREVLEGEVIEEDACHTCRCSKKQKICNGIPCTSSAPLKSSEATTVTPKPEKPHDEPLKCVTGWTNWISRDSPTPELNAESVDNEPLPKLNELPLGSPACKQEKMTKIECRTIIGYKSPKETGLNVECSLERGLVCKESGVNVCPDFEIRVYCECEEEPFQCLNSDHPNYPHPTDCNKFYECTPDMENPSKPHTVLKSCAEGLMYNPTLMICDWPAAVIATRPECGKNTDEETITKERIPASTATSATGTTPTIPTTHKLPAIPTTLTTPAIPGICPPGQVYSECAYPCDKLCDHFKKTLHDKGKCFVGLGDKCVKGCVDKAVAETNCSEGRWRDENTCVPEKDCTCYDKGNIIKPGGVVVDGCVKCQCLDNDLHCDASDCATTFLPIRTPSLNSEPILIMSTEQAHTPSISPLILLSSVTPPPECSPDNYINLLESVPDTAFSASSVAEPLFEPSYASLHRPSKNITGGSWNPSVTDQNQYIQVELPRKEPIYGVVTEGNPIFNEYVSSYEIMYGDDGSSYTTVNGPDGKPKVFKGPTDHKIPSKQMIEPPIEARFIRLRPLTWHEGIAVQFELIGCKELLSTTVSTVKTTNTVTPTPSTVTPIIVKSTVSPPPECNPDSYINLLENREIPDVAYSASSVAGLLFMPPYASLHRRSKNLTGGTWNPSKIDQNQYIQVELPQREPIYGVVVEGSPIFDEYITSYEVMYGDDGNIFSTVDGPDGKPKVFRGPADSKIPVKQMIEPPIEARYVRLRPLTWHEGIAVQFELIGCQEPLSTITTETTLTTDSLQCTESLGLAAGLPVESIEVSSNNDARQYFALDGARGWRPAYSTPGEWIMFDFQSPRNITGIKTKGGPKGWVTSYNIMYTSDLNTFNPVVDSTGKRVVFPGNFDRDSVVTNEFHPPINARYFKVLPLKWKDNIEVKVEPIGCFEPYSTTATTPSPTKVALTTEEPMQCTEPLGLAAELPVESIEVSSNNDARQYFALEGARGWRPAYSTPGEWIMFDFQSPRNITGIKTKGGPKGWVTSYNIMYTSDLNTFNPVVDSTGKRVVFPGNFDRDSVVTNELHPPIHARYFKVLPLKWKDNIEMRVEPIGCFEPYSTTATTPSPTKVVLTTEEPMQCTEPLGLAAELPVESIEVSSNNDARQYFALEGARGWRPAYSTPGEWIMFDFQSPRNITGIKTKGGPKGWVTSYNIMYTSDLNTFNPVVDSTGKHVVFPGNFDRDSVVTNELHPPIHARYFKVLPLKWKDNIEMRVEPIGCFEPYSTTATTPSPTKRVPTTEEPMQCTEPLGLAAELPVESIEVSSNNDARQYFSLDGTRGWRPVYSTPGEWIMFDFQSPRNITGIKTKGGPKGWVTSYNIMYTSDLNTFNPVVDSTGKRVVFPGNFDRDSVVTNELHPPIHARYFKVLPLKWKDNIEMRVEPIGCFEPYSTTATTPSPTKVALTTEEPMQCTEPLGLAAELPVESIEVSSNNDARQYFALEGARGWRPAYSTPGEWIMFDFQSPRNITGIKTKGGPKGWVTSYNIMYTSDLNTFNPVVDSTGKSVVFPGNFDRESVVTNEFHPPIHARYFKVLPLKWKDNIEMRVEPIGCFEPYSVTETVPTAIPGIDHSESLVVPCKPCPGIRASKCVCTTPEAPYFDGENCVSRDQCPCVESFMTYGVGSTFRGSECNECVCKLGGVTICKPVKECKCAPNLVPKLVSSSCECFCETCPPGTKICPTSKLCLPLEKWCDGLQDCPDDERECSNAVTPTVITTVTIEPTFVVTKVPTAAATQLTTVSTTVKPLECPKVECPPGYMVRYTSTSSSSYSRSSTSDLPPPRPRVSYQRYSKGGAAKGGSYAKGGYSKTGYSKGGYSKGAYSGGPSQPQSNQAFTLDKPSINNNSQAQSKQECAQFKCIPNLPPIPRPGSTPAPVVCSAPTCPTQYSLKLESVPTEANKCPQYVCVPPPERPVYCNVTGRTINTFDGTEYKYDLCFHILARENRFDAWTILVRKKCRIDGCQNELLVRQDDQIILVKPNLMIEYDNYEYNVEQTSMICFQKNSFDIGRLGNGVAIKSRKFNFTVLYTTDGDIKIGVSKSYMGTVDGLCGAFDGVPSNDRRRPDGGLAASVDEFGRSWAKPGLPPDACRTKVIDSQKQKRVWDLCDAITKEPISQCAKVLNLDKWKSICLEKICECADLVVNSTKRTEEECRCLLVEKLVAECLAADKDLDVASWRMQLDCPAECPVPLVHYDCYRKRCEPTCGGSGTARSCPSEDGQCFPGCYCPEGKLRKGDVCVAPADCLDCVCNGVGTPSKFVTFERDDLPFGGNCTYLASRDRNETGQHKYEVYITNGPCAGNNDIVCTNIVHLIYEKNVIHITKDPITKKLQTTIGDSPVFKYPLKKDWVTINLVNGQDVSVALPDVHVELTVQQSKLDFTVRVPSHLYANQTEGLCGVCAGYQEHLITSNGSVTDNLEEYGKSWQATPEVLTTLDVPPQEQCDEIPREKECIPPQSDQNPCYNIYNEEKFGACHPLVDPEEYVLMCEEELCALNSSDVCALLERYASECRQQGVCLDWRGDLCPHPCAEPLVYRPCVDCERTCDNDEELKKNPKKCDKRPVEGCFCPEGKVRVNNTCIEPTKCFPCDAKKEHYAGDEWQEDACTKCSCSKLSDESRAHVSCTTQTCSTPVCSEEEDIIAKPKRPDACCTEYMCVPKPQDNPQCDEPKKMECGFGQVLKQKTKANGCKEFACECKPASECEHIPTENEVDILEPGMERLVDNSGCCPRVQLLCRKETCPGEPECPQFHLLKTKNDTGKCCPEYSCELPKDKCVVNLEWEAASKGGEKPRKKPQVMLKDLDSAWLDGPCRSCRCEASPLGAVPRCSVTECTPVTSTEQFVLEPRPMPFACCPRPVQVACRDGDNIYKVGENWTSPYDVCESYECVEVDDGKLERITTLQTCHEDCQPGWKYFPAERESKQCCGKCRPVACVVNGEEHAIGDRWTSPDHCTNYTCVDVDGTLQVQSSDELCPEPSTALKKQFVLKEDKVPGQCCSTHEPVACRVGNKIYQEGQTWPSPDPCRNVTCARDVTGRLTQTESVETCVKKCKRGWKYVEPEAGVCCGHCVQDACVVDDELRKPGTTWQSADNCTTYSCEGSADGMYVTSARESCPDVSACKLEDLINDTCCQICVEKPSSLSTCVPERVENAELVGLIRIRLGAHGVCINKQPLNQLKECRGNCGSGTIYNNRTGSHDSNCECCQAVKYEPIVVELSCDDGTLQQHRVASPAQCKCQKCGGGNTWPTKTGYSGTKNPPSKGGYGDYEIPSMYARFGESTEIPTR